MAAIVGDGIDVVFSGVAVGVGVKLLVGVGLWARLVMPGSKKHIKIEILNRVRINII
jgi:hypothetical protein